jgi:two-component system, sensor histidine kinase and response regulator
LQHPFYVNNQDLTSLKILVVDDNETSREILCHLLESFGYQVDQIDSGRAAIELLTQSDKKTPYDLVLMDWRMAELDGIETTRIIQNELNINYCPTVIMISAYSQVELKKAAKGVDFAALLPKPVTPSSLFNAILVAMGHEAVAVRRSQFTPEETLKAISQLQGAKILLVEDNEINLELAVKLLTTNGIDVDFAHDGQEALQMLEQDCYDGVLMDCQMPVMDGYEATREIRKMDPLKMLPVLAMTANVMSADKQKSKEAGMDDHIAKPVNPDILFATMAKWITPKRPIDNGELMGLPKIPVVPEPFPDLPGIDTRLGLKTTQNNVKLYQRLLLKFNVGQRTFKKDFRDAQNDNDLELAVRIAHTLKGVAGNLGMTDVQQSAASLVTACEKQTDTVNEFLDMVIIHLEKVFDSLDTWQADTGETQVVQTPSASIDLASLEPLILQLYDYTENSNIASDDLVKQIKPLLLCDTDLLKYLEQVNSLVQEYDFDQAVEAVKQLADKLNISLSPSS